MLPEEILRQPSSNLKTGLPLRRVSFLFSLEVTMDIDAPIRIFTADDACSP